MVPAAEKCHTAVRHLEAVTDRAIAQQPARQSLVMQFIGHVGPQIVHACCQQHLFSPEFASARADSEVIAIPQHAFRTFCQDAGAERSGLPLHPLQQFGAGNAFGISCVVARLRNEGSPASLVIEHAYREVEARQIDRRRQPRRPAADHDAIMVHA